MGKEAQQRALPGHEDPVVHSSEVDSRVGEVRCRACRRCALGQPCVQWLCALHASGITRLVPAFVNWIVRSEGLFQAWSGLPAGCCRDQRPGGVATADSRRGSAGAQGVQQAQRGQEAQATEEACSHQWHGQWHGH